MTTLPPDQSYRDYTTGTGDTQQRIILSVSDRGISLAEEWGNDLSSVPNGTHIFAERVELAETFSVSNINPPHAFTLSTTHLDFSAASEGEKREIPVLAVPGQNNDAGTERNASTIDGKPAPHLAVYVQNCTKPIVDRLYLSAHGGKGGDTKEEGGTAGNGGNGGYIQFIGLSELSQYAKPLYEVMNALRAIHKTSGNILLDGNHPLFLTIGDVLQAASESTTTPDLTTALKELRSALARWKSSGGWATEIFDATKDSYTAVLGCWKDAIDDFRYHSDVYGGAGGSAPIVDDGGPRGSSGEPGSTGSDSLHVLFVPFSKGDCEILRQQTHIFVHPEQCEMLYKRAMTFWTLDARAEAMEILTRLILRLEFLPLQPGDALYQAYRAQEVALQCPQSIERLGAVQKSALAQLSVMANGLVEYHGRSPRWVPRLSYSVYRESVRQALKAHEKFEKSYVAYAAAKKKKDEAKKKMRAIKEDADDQIADIEDEEEDEREALVALKKRIYAAERPIKQAHLRFQNLFEAARDKIIHTYDLSPETMISAAKYIVSIYADKEELAKLAYKIGKEVVLKVPDNAGEVVDKDLLIEQIRSGAATALSNFQVDIDANDLDGMYDEDVRVPKMLLERETLDQIFGDYTKSAFAKVGWDLREAFKVLTDMLVAWNNDKLAYNASLSSLADLLEQKKEANDAKSLADKETITDPDLDQMTELAASIYNNSRARVLGSVRGFLQHAFEDLPAQITSCLREAQLALWFKTLVPPTPLYRIGKAAGVAIDDLPVSITSDVLENMHQKLSDDFNRIRNDSSNAPTSFPANWDNTQGLKCWLPADLLQELYDNRRINVFIPPVLRGQTADDLRGQINCDFVGMADVRIHRVRFFWKGLKELKSSDPNADAARLQTDIFHNGRESIVSREGDVWVFEHKRLDTMHSYFYCNDKPVDQHAGTFNGGSKRPTDVVGEDTELGQPGPFTTWTLDVSSTDWSKWRVDDAKDSKLEGYIEFSGSNYPFEP